MITIVHLSAVFHLSSNLVSQGTLMYHIVCVTGKFDLSVAKSPCTYQLKEPLLTLVDCIDILRKVTAINTGKARKKAQSERGRGIKGA